MPYGAKEVRKTNNRSKGDALGEIDKDGIAQWYPNCKVRKEGDVYIATPHTTNPTKRTVRKQKEIAVSVKDGKYALEEKPIENTAVNDGIQPVTVDGGQVAEQADKSPPAAKEQPKTDVRITTLKDIFDELYDKYYKQYPKQDVKPYYSKGLYRFIESDVDGNDVIGKMELIDERDIRLLVRDKFNIWDEGALIGEASPETIAQAPKIA